MPHQDPSRSRLLASGDSVPDRMRMLFSLIESASCKKGNDMQIAGSSAIVVGGAGGLGEATVRRLHARGSQGCRRRPRRRQGQGAGERARRALRAHRRHLGGVRQRGDRRGRVVGPAADLGRHPRRSGQWWPADRQGRLPARPRRLQEDDRVLSDCGVQRDAAVGSGDREVRAVGGGRSRRRSSTRRRSRDTRARSASSPTRRPRAACSA